MKSDDLFDEIHRILFLPPGDQGDAALELLRRLGRGRELRMNDVADLVASARFKNRYQINNGGSTTLRSAERFIVGISGAYAVPLTFKGFIHLPEEADDGR